MLGLTQGLAKTRGHGIVFDSSARTLAALGDSIIGSSTATSGSVEYNESQGFITPLRNLNAQRFTFDKTLNKGVSGDSTTLMLARIHTDFDALAYDLVVIMGGTNDVAAKVATATILSNLAGIRDYFVAAGKRMVFVAITPRSYWPGLSAGEITTAKQSILDINATLQSWANGDTILFASAYSDFNDGNNEPKANWTYDGLHPSPYGSYYVGRAVHEVLKLYYGCGSFNNTGNLISNYNYAGTGGTIGTAATGQCADNTTVETGGTTSSSTRTLSKYNGGQRLQANFGSALSNTEALRLRGDTLSSGWTSGKKYVYEVELEVLSGSGMWYTLSTELRNQSSGFAFGNDKRNNDNQLPYDEYAAFCATGKKILIRSAPTLVDGTWTSMRPRLNLECNCTSAAAAADIVLYNQRLYQYD